MNSFISTDQKTRCSLGILAFVFTVLPFVVSHIDHAWNWDIAQKATRAVHTLTGCGMVIAGIASVLTQLLLEHRYSFVAGASSLPGMRWGQTLPTAIDRNCLSVDESSIFKTDCGDYPCNVLRFPPSA